MGFPANNISRPGQPLLVEVEPGLTDDGIGYEQDNAFIRPHGGPAMTIQRVPNVPFAQIANSALRDKRLSFKARGVLALVLSNVGDWEASLDWLLRQSDNDGRHSIQQALNELTALGYREVSKTLINGKIRTIVEWRHEPDVLISRPTENPTVGKSDRRETGASYRTPSLEHHIKEQQDISDFEEFWSVYPKKVAKAKSLHCWRKARKTTESDVLINAAKSYRDDSKRDADFTLNPTTWLNQERWLDEPAVKPAPSRPVTFMEQVAEPCEHGDPRGSGSCALCRRSS